MKKGPWRRFWDRFWFRMIDDPFFAYVMVYLFIGIIIGIIVILYAIAIGYFDWAVAMDGLRPSFDNLAKEILITNETS